VHETPSPLDQAAAQLRLVRGQVPPGEHVTLPLRSGSMLPSLPVGSSLVIRSQAGSRCAVGDVVVFKREGRLVAHRLLLAWGRGYVERGDGVSSAGHVRADAILGRVVTVRRPDGRTLDLDTSAARRAGRRAAAASLLRWVRGGLLAPFRRLERWLTRGNSDSG
jgi:hypothetical protein